jgi:uncharacterized protein YeaO (DUF488 family)
MIHVQRVYESARKTSGPCYLVDHLWPRGVQGETLHLAGWLKELAPSDRLRKWFSHDPAKWAEFQQRYAAELDAHPEAWQPLAEAAREGDVTLLYAAHDAEHNNAVALRQYLERKRAA